MNRKLALVTLATVLALGGFWVFHRGPAPVPSPESRPVSAAPAGSIAPLAAEPALAPAAPLASAAAQPSSKPRAAAIESAAILAPSSDLTSDGWEIIRYPDAKDGEPLWAGEPVVARVEYEGRRVQLTPNQLGEFPRLNLASGARARVELHFPEAESASPVAIAPLDGGTLEDGRVTLAREINAERRLRFGFTASTFDGVHRVQIRRPGQEPVVLEFWAGQPELHRFAAR